MQDDSRIPTVPDWVYSPDSFIRSKITSYLIGLVLGFVSYVTGILNDAFTSVTDALSSAGGAFSGGFGAAGQALFGSVELLSMAVYNAAMSIGPFGLPLLAFVAVVVGVLMYRLFWALMDSVPILSGVETFFKR
jgi:uncharacterized membrane protein